MRPGHGKRQREVINALQGAEGGASILWLTCTVFRIPMVRGMRPSEVRAQYESIRYAVQRLTELGQIERVVGKISLDGGAVWRLTDRAPRVIAEISRLGVVA